MSQHLKISKYRPSVLQGALQLEVTKPRASLAKELAYERHAIAALSTMLLLLVALYLYFVAASILNVMGKTEAERNMRDIEGSMGSLEQKYLALSQSINQDEAGSLGLAPVQSVSYVYRPTASAMADTNTNEI